MIPSITQDQVNIALGDFIQAQTGLTTIVGQVNRVPQPEGDSIVMWPLRRPRFSTNVEANSDVHFNGSIAAGILTVASALFGVVEKGRTISALGVASGTIVGTQISGSVGGLGTYNVSPSQTVSLEEMSIGATELAQSTESVMQIDVHGPASSDNAQVVSTLLRSGFAVAAMAASGVAPLYSEDPVQTPFMTAADQYEDRWTIEVHLQINPVIEVPQEFAGAITVNTIEVETTFPIT